MSAVSSSVGIISQNPTDELTHKAQQMGAEVVSHLNSPVEGYNLLVFDLEEDSLSEVQSLLAELSNNTQNINLCLLVGEIQSTQLYELSSNFKIDKIIKKNEIPILEHLLYESLESFNQKKQFTDYEKLVNEQNAKLQELKQDLEERIKRRQLHLENLNKKLMQTQKRTKILNSCLLSIYQSKNFHEIETKTTRSLKPLIQLDWIRISLNMLNEFEQKFESQHSLYKIQLDLTKTSAHVYFAKKSGEVFSKEDKTFLQQLIEPLTIAVDRLIKLEQTETLRFQWESTFDAITEPICLTDNNFEIIKTNKAFDKLLKKHSRPLSSNVLNRIFWSEDLPDTYNLEADKIYTFQMQDHEEIYIYELIEQKIELNINDTSQDSYIFLFRDVTLDKRLERQLLETSKMKELGTIGSSMAHELNNPLGGIISFIQLIEMDLNPESPIKDDIIEMKSAALRCKELIDHLLGFSRRQDTSENEDFDISTCLNTSIRLFENQAKSLGIFIDTAFDKNSLSLHGNQNQITQAFNNVIQNSIEALKQKLEEESNFEAHIRITTRSLKDMFEVIITDNGPGISQNILHKVFNPLFTTKNPKDHSGLGLTIAFQIMQSHNGILEIFSQPMAGTSVKFSFERLDLPSKKQFQT